MKYGAIQNAERHSIFVAAGFSFAAYDIATSA